MFGSITALQTPCTDNAIDTLVTLRDKNKNKQTIKTTLTEKKCVCVGWNSSGAIKPLEPDLIDLLAAIDKLDR